MFLLSAGLAAAGKLYGNLPLGEQERLALEKMEASSGLGITRAEVLSTLENENARLILLETGFHVSGGYEGALWMKSGAGCRLLVVSDRHPEDSGKIVADERDVDCSEFDSLWSRLKAQGAFHAKTLARPGKSTPQGHGATTGRDDAISGGTYFFSVRGGAVTNTFAAYEPCRAAGAEESKSPCAVMATVQDATQRLAPVGYGPAPR